MTLIERLEALTGPCRECDCLIALEAGWDIPMPMAPLPNLVMKFGEEWLLEAATEYNSAYNRLPAYTASIDAAMTLVPEGCMWNVGGHPNGGFASAGLFGAAIWQGIDQIHGEAPTPAIALCIAALKARQ